LHSIAKNETTKTNIIKRKKYNIKNNIKQTEIGDDETLDRDEGITE
jgi:hypothetical protein